MLKSVMGICRSPGRTTCSYCPINTKSAIVGSRDIPDCEAKSNKDCWVITFLSSRIKRFRKGDHFVEKKKDETLQEFETGKLAVQGGWGQIQGIFPSTRMNVADIQLQQTNKQTKQTREGSCALA